ncbi:hypothetical protein LEP1GSC051_1410 [Leptospira sp. P2653]|nr:hypothetical protein LEP1GSC051_1410 [Leptospira sp. P2653]
MSKVPKSTQRKLQSIRFTYEKKSNRFICPTGRVLKFRTENIFMEKIVIRIFVRLVVPVVV